MDHNSNPGIVCICGIFQALISFPRGIAPQSYIPANRNTRLLIPHSLIHSLIHYITHSLIHLINQSINHRKGVYLISSQSLSEVIIIEHLRVTSTNEVS